jgi:hypothetical protein
MYFRTSVRISALPEVLPEIDTPLRRYDVLYLFIMVLYANEVRTIPEVQSSKVLLSYVYNVVRKYFRTVVRKYLRTVQYNYNYT